ncbi:MULTISPECIES: MaoC family dehydratase [unclassified Kitasatospora]|uniref:MaoC family dehydratase n=1 Tax=unclassified Kitasatospora TaxID=2633591 RepID=UPI0033E46F86
MSTTAHGIEEIRAQAGTDLGHTAWREIAQPRVDLFADATDDHQWIHTDVERARTGPFGGTIAHGYLTLSLLIPLWSELLVVEGVSMAVNYGLNKVRFPAPVPVGAKIRAHGAVVSVEDVKGGGVEVVVDLTVEIDGSAKPACVAQAVYRFYA